MNGGGGVVFATGTPIANSMAEMFTMQRYLQMPALKKHKVASLRFVGGDVRRAGHGDGTFAGRRGLPAEHAFARFINVPELMQMFRQVADIQTPRCSNCPCPRLRTGKPHRDQRAVFAGVEGDRAKVWSNGPRRCVPAG
jgi:N12 class adenine-specific DNA methylase